MNKKEFNEASMTTTIKGYLSNRKANMSKSDKKNKNQKPWYLHNNNDIEDMVRRDLSERRNLLEATKTNEKIESLRDAAKKIKEKLKSDPQNQDLRKQFQDLAEMIQDEMRKLNPSKVPSGKEADRSKFSGGGRPDTVEPRKSDDVWKAREVPELSDPGEHVKELQKQLLKTKDDLKKDPEDFTLQRRVRSIEKEIKRVEKAVQLGGEKWRDHLIDPESKAKSKEKRLASAEERGVKSLRKSESPYVSVAQDVIKKFESDPTAWQDSQNKHVIFSGLKILKKYIGTIPSSEVEHKRIENWVDNTLIGKFDGDLKAYAATREPKVGIRRGTPKMKIKTGRGGDKTPVSATHTAEPMPGAIKDLFSLHKELEKTPQHQQSPFSPPSSVGRGMASDPGSGGRILKNVYEKIIKGLIDDPEYLKKVDPEALGIKKHELTKFEQALGPFLRNLYKKAGYSVPDWEGEPEVQKVTEPLEPTETPEERSERDDEKVAASLGKVKQFQGRKRSAGAEDFDEPRDPEELARRREKEAGFRQAAQMSREKLPVKQPKFGDLEKSRKSAETEMGREAEAEEQKKKDLLNLINKRRAEKMTSPNESFNISELFEGFENSYELDPETKEEEWESATAPAKKDWKKELSLESLLPSEKK